MNAMEQERQNTIEQELPKKIAKSIMIQGTMSNAGKSLVVAGLCRIFKQDGYKVAPFKSQNMALNSFITKENLEMGRAQVVQAEAAGIEPSVRMNPILLKPTTDMGSQVIVNGKVVGDMHAAEYFKHKKDYIPAIMEAYQSLAAENDIIVIEGAGSPAEINLKQDDIVNMGMAKLVDAPVLLVGDIDRGGVFAQLCGTVMLLEDDEKDRIQGLIINKFRGDSKILEPGLVMLEQRCNKKVLGVIPYSDVKIEEEDSLASELEKTVLLNNPENVLDIVVIRLPKISNFTDFEVFSMEENVSVRYVKNVRELGKPDVIILPGTKSTISDLQWLRTSGLEAVIKKLNAGGTPIIGICGGYQMLGGTITDKEGAENFGTMEGMKLLPCDTEFYKEKTRTQISGTMPEITGFYQKLSNVKFVGYEIHMGQSQRECASGNVLGTYVHGIFDEDEFRSKLLDLLFENCKKTRWQNSTISYAEYKEIQYNKLADIIRSSIDMKEVYRILDL